MLEDPYNFKPQPSSRFWGWTLAAWLVVIVLFGLGLAWCAQAQEQPQIKCMDGKCLVPLELLQSLINDANAAESYAKMCGWK